MLSLLFGGLLGASLLWGCVRGNGDQVMAQVLAAGRESVQTVIELAGGFAFFCGILEIFTKSGGSDALARKLQRPLQKFLGKDMNQHAVPLAAMNLAANMLGLGNAATPLGIRAAQMMAAGERAGNALCLFLVINSSSVQLLPSTVMALRAAAGSADPGAVMLPGLAATGISTVVGIVSCKLMERWT